MSATPTATGEHHGGHDAATAPMRRCGRCRALFAAAADVHPAELKDWWACPECHEAVIPHQGPAAG